MDKKELRYGVSIHARVGRTMNYQHAVEKEWLYLMEKGCFWKPHRSSDEGSTYVPLRFISQNIGPKVDFDNENRIALINLAK